MEACKLHVLSHALYALPHFAVKTFCLAFSHCIAVLKLGVSYVVCCLSGVASNHGEASCLSKCACLEILKEAGVNCLAEV